MHIRRGDKTQGCNRGSHGTCVNPNMHQKAESVEHPYEAFAGALRDIVERMHIRDRPNAVFVASDDAGAAPAIAAMSSSGEDGNNNNDDNASSTSTSSSASYASPLHELLPPGVAVLVAHSTGGVGETSVHKRTFDIGKGDGGYRDVQHALAAAVDLLLLSETNPLIFTQSSGYGKLAWARAMATRGGCLGWVTLDSAARNFTSDLEGMCDVCVRRTVQEAADVSGGGVAGRTKLERVMVGKGLRRSGGGGAVGACDVEQRIVAAPTAVGGGDGGETTVETYYGSCSCSLIYKHP